MLQPFQAHGACGGQPAIFPLLFKLSGMLTTVFSGDHSNPHPQSLAVRQHSGHLSPGVWVDLAEIIK